jgi:TolB-like protein
VGVHEDVMATLSGLGDLRVISRTSVRRLRVEGMTLPEIGKRLGAEYVLEGSVRRAGNQVRVTTQLFEAATDRSLWSATYDREMTDLLALQADLAREIAGTLQAHLSPREEERLASPRKVVVEAYDDYVRARELLHGFWVGYGDLEEAATLLDDAVAADPGFVEGWALLSRAQADLADRMREMDDRGAEAAAAADAARIALERARALDPDGVATLKAEAFYHEEVEGDPVAALRYLDRAEEIAPSDSDARFLQAVLAMRLGQLDRAIAIMERTFRLDSVNLFYGFALTYAYDLAGRYGDAVPFLERLLELEPERTHYAVRAAYFRFLDEGSLEAYRAFEETIRTIPRPDACDTRSVQNHEMIVALLDDDFEGYATRWQGKWEAHHRGHGNWACPAQINEETNHARLLLEQGRTAAADSVLALARASTARPYTEDSVCIFDRAAFLPKLAWLAGDEADAREELEEALPRILTNDLVPRGPVERAVLLETADLVVPDRVYSIYRQIQEHPLPGITLEGVCANPWLFPNLLRDPRFVTEVREDGRFVGFLEHFGVLSPIG